MHLPRWGQGRIGGRARRYAAVRAVYLGAVAPGVRLSALGALAAASTPAELSATLEFALSGDVRAQDAVGLVGAVAGNPLGRALAWAFVKANWSVFSARYGAGGFAISGLVDACTTGFSTPAAQTDVEVRACVCGCVGVWVLRACVYAFVCVNVSFRLINVWGVCDCVRACVCVVCGAVCTSARCPQARAQEFWAYHPAPAASRSIAMGLEAIGGNVQWVANSLAPTCAWLATLA